MKLNDIPDHPIIRNLQGTGYPYGEEPNTMTCPKCGEDCDFYYIDWNDEIVGCENCISLWDADQCGRHEEQ